MNNCLSSQDLDLYGSEVAKVVEILINSFCCDDVYQALALAADVLRESFQSLSAALMPANQPRSAPIAKIGFDDIKHGKAQTAAFINGRYVPP